MAADHAHAEHFMKCAKACAECQLECDSCFTHCVSLLGEGKKEHAATAQLCADCSACCQLGSSLSARQSPLAGPACEACAKACDICAAACEKLPSDKHMAQCAKSCRDCAKSLPGNAEARGLDEMSLAALVRSYRGSSASRL
jgi:hypothetical protein